VKLLLTGAEGFLGWHLRCRVHATTDHEVVPVGRADWHRLPDLVGDVDAVIHVAGVNRAPDDELVDGNVSLARDVADALSGTSGVVVVFANSIQVGNGSAYATGKEQAAGVLRTAAERAGGRLVDVHLPNLFGEHGRPGYNSFVATFAHEIAAGRTPTVTGDREIELMHAQDAAAALIGAAGTDQRTVVRGEAVQISVVLTAFQEFHELYGARGEIPDVSDRFRLNLFNTYRAAAFGDGRGVAPKVHSDPRGNLFEVVRSHGGTGMAYASTTKPGQKRGEHYHLRKIERFVVVGGEAEIELRRLLHDEVVTVNVSGDAPVFVDMPTLWVHNIRNVGNSDLLTLFWADQLLDPESPDQFPETIALEART
jgi:UDP-2-acetamido-2,6-beta-L-arabino-hexul-4-ose reductase